jgi:hypothetical protein
VATELVLMRNAYCISNQFLEVGEATTLMSPAVTGESKLSGGEPVKSICSHLRFF